MILSTSLFPSHELLTHAIVSSLYPALQLQHENIIACNHTKNKQWNAAW